MDSVPRDLINICRFCLCQDESKLRSIEEILPLSIKDVEHFTGIKINMDENLTYAICFDCTQKLRISANFRQFCLRNNAHFQELLGVLLASMKSVPTDSVKPKMHEERDPLDLHFVVVDNDNEVKEIKLEEDDVAGFENNDNNAYNQHQKAWSEYSANYIALGECVESDDHEPTFCIFDHEYSALSKRSGNKTSQICSKSRTKPTVAIPPNEHPPLRKTLTTRTKKSYRRLQLCSLCGKLVKNYVFHLRFHANERKHACPHCPQRMTDKGNLDRHVKAVHLKIIVKTCPVCGRGFTNNNSYQTHMVGRHGTGNRVACMVCSRTFCHKSKLPLHMKRAHSNVRDTPCDICGKPFKDNQQLKNHMRVHSTDQPFPCGKCPKRFKSRYAMKTHELTHSGILFDCVLCGKKYRYKSLLNMHIRKMHSEKEELENEEEYLGHNSGQMFPLDDD